MPWRLEQRVESQVNEEIKPEGAGPNWGMLNSFSFYGTPPEEEQLIREIRKHLVRRPRENKTLRFLRGKEFEEGSQDPGADRLHEVVTSVIST